MWQTKDWSQYWEKEVFRNRQQCTICKEKFTDIKTGQTGSLFSVNCSHFDVDKNEKAFCDEANKDDIKQFNEEIDGIKQ